MPGGRSLSWHAAFHDILLYHPVFVSPGTLSVWTLGVFSFSSILVSFRLPTYNIDFQAYMRSLSPAHTHTPSEAEHLFDHHP